MWKAFWFAVLIACSTPVCLHAQTTLSAIAGASIATATGDRLPDVQHVTRVRFGAQLDLPISDRMGIQLGATYAQKGVDFDTSDEFGRLHFDYFEFPLLLRLNLLPNSEGIAPHLLLGPAVAIEFKCQLPDFQPIGALTRDCRFIEVALDDLDVGAIAGLGIRIPVTGQTSLTLSALFNQALTGAAEGVLDVTNRAFYMTAGLGVRLP
ncbi:MAG: outer membrane beta-barrel protein [Gemmatimonadota bacterium]